MKKYNDEYVRSILGEELLAKGFVLVKCRVACYELNSVMVFLGCTMAWTYNITIPYKEYGSINRTLELVDKLLKIKRE